MLYGPACHTTICLLLLLKASQYVSSVALPGEVQPHLSKSAFQSKCPGCAGKGTCNEEIGSCECPKHLSGVDCSQQLLINQQTCKAYGFPGDMCFDDSIHLCFNSCHGRGRCMAGFCICNLGYFGADCALSLDPSGKPQLLAGQGYQERNDSIKIYVYELPAAANTWGNIMRLDRPLVAVLWQRMMSGRVRTTDGDQADYFLIPINLRTRTQAANHMTMSINFIRQHWPWWDKYHGARHLLVAPSDIGRATLPHDLLALTINCTYLHSWGLSQERPLLGWPAAHRPEQDIVMPSLNMPADPLDLTPLHPNATRPPRESTLFFAGRICGNRHSPVNGSCSNERKDYSAGTRQQVYHHHWNRTGYTLVNGTAKYARDFSTHKFCLAPTGGGYGKRNVLAALMGCVPVTVTDHVLQPFEPELRWADFSVPVAEADIPRMHTILEELPPAQLELMQSRLHCAAQHLYYSTTFGGVLGESGRYDAFETLLEVLRLRRDRAVRGLQALAHMRWSKFAACDLAADVSGASRDPMLLCNQNHAIKGEVTCRQCWSEVPHSNLRFFYSWPGGAVCCNQSLVAQCPVAWV